MERLMLRGLLVACLASIPFLFKKKGLIIWLLVFFSKGVLATIVDNFAVGTGRIKYPVRFFPKIFKTNILYNLLYFPLLSVVWSQITYYAPPTSILLKSLYFSVPMSICQWWMEKKTRLFEWKRWSIFHTFLCVNFSLFTIRGFVSIIKKIPVQDINSKNSLQ
ncbi:CBO0543 family protein [Virgibacillus ndiopensis]|uniref:CBO0543 family protein n=1 Tax=Virgibacillus ndiopensis TaxID=2004408 RepID=UPI000C0789C1|nr:CBO0543 family protein [Virgibacillus ndiopensis]